MTTPPTRQQIIDTLHHTLQAIPAARAAYLGGSDATGRTDRYSDVDIQVIVAAAAAIDDLFTAVAAALNQLAPIDRQYRRADPGFEQVFYHLAGTPDWLLVDMVALLPDAPEKFLAMERHGTAVLLFDHDGLTTPPPFDQVAHREKMTARREQLCQRFHIFKGFVDKAINRGDVLDAVATYHALTIRSLVELLKMRHCPERYDYGMRYADRDLPPAVHTRLQSLMFCRDLTELRGQQATAVAWFEAVEQEFT